MKKGMSLLLAAGLTLGAFPAVTHAEVTSYVNVHLNGKKVQFPDAHPFVNNDYRTIVPVRFVTESLGANVQWLGETQTVKISMQDRDISLRVGDNRAVVNGEEKMLDTQVTLINNRTYVPLRFVSESLNAAVEYDAPNQTVRIQTKDYQAEPNAKFDPWGRQIRTTNLPSNHAQFPYILEDIPNEMYEFKLNNVEQARFKTPAQLYAKYPEFTKENLQLWMERVRKHYALILNVDYRTIDSTWPGKVYSYRVLGQTFAYEADPYVKWVKDNKIQIEGYLDPEPSIIYNDGWTNDSVRAKIKFRILNYDRYDKIFYDTWFYPEQYKFEKGVWYTGYTDVNIAPYGFGEWGPTVHVDGMATLFENFSLRPQQ